MYHLRCCLCVRFQPGKILLGLSKENPAQTGGGKDAEDALSCDAVKGENALFYAS